MSVYAEEDLDTKGEGKQADHDTLPGCREINPSPGLEPSVFHGKLAVLAVDGSCSINELYNTKFFSEYKICEPMLSLSSL